MIPVITISHLCCRAESEGPKSLAIAVSLLAPEVQVLDMPVDPNEPTYCLCHQVSVHHLQHTRKISRGLNKTRTGPFIRARLM